MPNKSKEQKEQRELEEKIAEDLLQFILENLDYIDWISNDDDLSWESATDRVKSPFLKEARHLVSEVLADRCVMLKERSQPSCLNSRELYCYDNGWRPVLTIEKE